MGTFSSINQSDEPGNETFAQRLPKANYPVQRRRYHDTDVAEVCDVGRTGIVFSMQESSQESIIEDG